MRGLVDGFLFELGRDLAALGLLLALLVVALLLGAVTKGLRRVFGPEDGRGVE